MSENHKDFLEHHTTPKPPVETSPVKDNFLCILFLLQLYNTIGPLIEKKFQLSLVLSDSKSIEAVQSGAIASMFIASTFFLTASEKPITRQRKVAALLASVLFATGFILAVAKNWFEKI